MIEIDSQKLCWCSKEQIIELKKRINDYIVPCDKNKITWQVFNYLQMQQFLNLNYYDNNNNLIYWLDKGEETPIGMTFLTFPPYNEKIKFFIGTIDSHNGKKMIVGCICFFNHLQLAKNTDLVTSIETVEINYFYQGQGLLQIMLDEFSKIVLKNQNIIMTMESEMGKTCHVMNHLKESLLKVDFKKDIRFEDEIDDEYIKKLVKQI